MPQVYEVEYQGQTYEVEADSPEQAAAAFGPAPAQQAAPANNSAALDQAVQMQQFGQMSAGPLSETQTQEQRAAAWEGARQAPLSLGSGLVEGLQRVVGGGKQLYGAVSDYFTGLDKAGRGAKDKYTAQEMLRAAVAEAEAKDAGRIPEARNLAAGAAQLGTLAVAPEAALPRATTVIGALAKNFTSGAIGGALTFDPEGSKADDALGGGATSALIGIVPSLPPAIKNVVGRGLARVNREGRTGARVAAMEKVLPNTKVSLAQRTGVPELNYLEHRTYDLDQVNFFADQTDTFIADAAKALGQPLRPGQTLTADAAVMREAMDSHIKDIRNNASRTYQYGVSKAATMAGPDTTVPITNFRNTIREVIDEAKSYERVRDTPPIKKEYIDYLETLIKPDKTSMTVPELSRTLKELTAIQGSDDRIAKALGTKLRNQGLEADLDALQVVPQTDDAIKTLLQTRAEYRRSINAAQALADATVYKLLDDASEPTAMIRKLESYSPSKQDSVRTFLEQHNPSMLRSLRQEVVNDAVGQAGTIRAGADAQQDLEKFERALFDGDRFKTSGLWGPKDMQKVDAIAEGLRVIKNTRPNVGSSGTPVAPEDVAINLVSRSGPFMARFLTRALTSGNASQFFTDPNIYQMMTRLNRSTTGSATNLAMRAALMAYLQEEYPGDQPQEGQQ